MEDLMKQLQDEMLEGVDEGGVPTSFVFWERLFNGLYESVGVDDAEGNVMMTRVPAGYSGSSVVSVGGVGDFVVQPVSRGYGECDPGLCPDGADVVVFQSAFVLESSGESSVVFVWVGCSVGGQRWFRVGSDGAYAVVNLGEGLQEFEGDEFLGVALPFLEFVSRVGLVYLGVDVGDAGVGVGDFVVGEVVRSAVGVLGDFEGSGVGEGVVSLRVGSARVLGGAGWLPLGDGLRRSLIRVDGEYDYARFGGGGGVSVTGVFNPGVTLVLNRAFKEVQGLSWGDVDAGVLGGLLGLPSGSWAGVLVPHAAALRVNSVLARYGQEFTGRFSAVDLGQIQKKNSFIRLELPVA